MLSKLEKFLVLHLLHRVAILSVFCLFSTCASSPPPSVYSSHFEGGTFYLCCNMYAPSPRFNDANYQFPGKFIPIGTPVKIKRFNDFEVIFTDLSTGATYTWVKKFARVPFASLLQVWFLKENPRSVVESYPENIKSAIYEGKIVEGMTKTQVIYAIGFPPQHKTPDTSLDRWVYWSQYRAYIIIFQNGVLTKIIK